MSEGSHGNGIDRRSFLKQGSGALLTLGLVHLAPVLPRPGRAAEGDATLAADEFAYRGWDDIYREAWTWDKVVHSSHARANCISGCSWLIFVKDGIAWREEQNAIYRSSEPGVVPDFNPRGCQKGHPTPA